MGNSSVTHCASNLKKMIMDACVLIDFIKAERSILPLIVKHVGPVHVTGPVIEEIKEIDNEEELVELGLIIVEPELEDAFAAASEKGPVSFQDCLCFLSARRHGFICVTNDKQLRKLCEHENVPVLWGLQLLVKLCQTGGIPVRDAIDMARRIHQINPKHITINIVEQFIDIIRKQ